MIWEINSATRAVYRWDREHFLNINMSELRTKIITSNGHRIISPIRQSQSKIFLIYLFDLFKLRYKFRLMQYSRNYLTEHLESSSCFTLFWIFPTNFSRFSHTTNGSLVRNSLTYLKIPGTSDAHQVARAVIRLNRAVTAFFVARYCASWSRQTRALNRDVYLKAHEMARLLLCVITCEDVSVLADSSDSGIWFLRIPREMLIICQGVAVSNDRKFNISVYNYT